MGEKDYQAGKRYVDAIGSFDAGVNSGIAASLLPKDQLASALNVSLRGDFLQPRPPLQFQNFVFSGAGSLQSLFLNGNFQGAGYYRPDTGPECLIAQISGHLLLFTISGSQWIVTDVSVPGDLNSATAQQVWMWQSEKWMIIQDGTGKLPIFFDGVSSRRSYGPSALLATTGADFVPPSPRVIGESVVVTLTAPYSGPYNIPVIFNGEFYQPAQSTGGYNVSIANINGTPGATIPAGQNVTVVPVQFLTVSNNITGYGVFPKIVFTIPVSNSIATNVLVGDSLSNVVISQGGYGTSTNTIKVTAVDAVANTINASFVPAQYATSVQILPCSITITGTRPSAVVGQTTAAITISAVGQSAVIKLTQQFYGVANQVVLIGGFYFYISPQGAITSGNQLALINLTDQKITTVNSGATIYSVPEIPAGRMGAYGMGCNCASLTDGLSYVIGDVVGSGSGTQASNYRDAVLKMTQNTFLAGGGSFRLPGAGDIITAVCFPSMLDTSLGNGPLQVATPFSMFSNYVIGTNPAGWAAITSPIQSESLKGKGPLSQNSTISLNSDTFFRSAEGIGSLVLARRDFIDNSWGNKPISNEMKSVLNNDQQSLLNFSSAISFDNRLFNTCAPYLSAGGVFHMGLAVLNLDLISSLRTSQPPAWEGLWTGINVTQLVTGRFNSIKRAFAFSYNYASSQNELYEILPESSAQFQDNGTTPIVWAFETPALFNQDLKPFSELVQLRDGEVYLSDIQGQVTVKVKYRSDYYPCWTDWNTFTVCQSTDASNSQVGYRTRIGLGEPSVDDVEIANNRPLRDGYHFQFRFEITGQCKFRGMRVSANAVPQPVFAPIQDANTPCQVIDCDVPNDLRLYNLDGLPPAS